MGCMWQCPGGTLLWCTALRYSGDGLHVGGTLLWCTALRYSGDGLHVAVSRGNTVVVYSTEVQW